MKWLLISLTFVVVILATDWKAWLKGLDENVKRRLVIQYVAHLEKKGWSLPDPRQVLDEQYMQCFTALQRTHFLKMWSSGYLIYGDLKERFWRKDG